MVAGTVVLLGVVSSAGCGTAAQVHVDGGDGSSITPTPDAPVGTWRSFDVAAVLTWADAFTDGQPLPPTNNFTLVVDADARLAIGGGNGNGAVVGLTSADGLTFRSTGGFIVNAANVQACKIHADVHYDSFEVTIVDGALTGTASGTARNPCEACGINVPFTATLTGTRDATPPALAVYGLAPVSPFDPFIINASEPLPASATARLVADDGAAIDLVPDLFDGDVPMVVGFYNPVVARRAGQGYTVALDGLVDFAGQGASSGSPLRIAFPAAPAMPEDGFESATAGSFGGATIMKEGPLPPIAGSTSLYFGTSVAPALDSSDGHVLMLRLSRQAGDTKLRFAYRTVALQAMMAFSGGLWAGAEGAPPDDLHPHSFLSAPTGLGQPLAVAGQAMFASAVTTMELPLPAGATGQVVFVIENNFPGCALPGAQSAGLLIDDLRLE